MKNGLHTLHHNGYGYIKDGNYNFFLTLITPSFKVTSKLFNFFKCGKGYIVDFPGYGFSKVSKTQKKEWFKEIPQYFEKRENLEHVILFTDARHPMRDQDVGMAEMLFDLNIPFKIVLTKSDKLKDKDKQQLVKSFEEIYPEFMLFSIDDKESIASLGKFINGLLSN